MATPRPPTAATAKYASLPQAEGYYVPPVTTLGNAFAVVIDTSVITSDVIKTAKGGLPSPLYVAMATELVRGFMAHHTWAEVPRVLAKRAPKEGVDPAVVERLWWDSYVKVIHFVPTGDLPPGDPDLERVLGVRDASDLPTVKLASLIARTVVLASDPDLLDIGLAYDRWWDVPDAVRKMVIGQGGTHLAAQALFGSAYGAVAIIRGMMATAWQRPRVAAGVLALAAVAIVTRERWLPPVRRFLDQASPRIGDVAAETGHWLFNALEEYQAARVLWYSAQRGVPGRTLVHAVARILSTSPRALTRTEIAERLPALVAARGHRTVMAALHVALNRHQAFCQVDRYHWQLGKDDAQLRPPDSHQLRSIAFRN